MVGCPGDAAVLAFTRGDLEEADLAGFDQHLDSCASCRQLVAVLSSTDESAGAATIALTAGQTLGRYTIQSMIGRGAAGRVYLARDGDLERNVAIKVLVSGTGDDLMAEAQAMAKLQHPNVVAVYEVGREGERVYLAMEHVDGGSLRSWMASKPDPAKVVEVFSAIADGLHAAHVAGLVHGDFKPDNVVIDSGGRPRVADFGLAPFAAGQAVDAADLTATRTVGLIGTPAYMAPEQLRGRLGDARSDQFSFFVALAEALTGRRPFAGRDLEELTATVSAGVPDLDTSVRPRLRRVLVQGLKARPDDRYPTMAAVADDLRVRPRRWGWMAGSAALAAAAVVAAVWMAGDKQPDSRVAAAPAPCQAPALLKWDPSRRAAIIGELSRGGPGYAATSAATVAELIDERVASLGRLAQEHCAEPASAPIRVCLGDTATALDDVIAGFGALSPSRRGSIVDEVIELPRAERCRSLSSWTAETAEQHTHQRTIARATIRLRRTGELDLDGLPSTGALAPERDLLIAEFELTAARYDRAEDAIHRVLATEPGPRLEARTWLLQAAVLGEKGDYKGARRAAEVAAATIQSLPEGQDLQIHGWHTSGLIKLGTGDPQGALADFGKAFDATEALYGPGHLHSVRALSHRGLAKKALGDLPGSLAEHDRALALDRTLRGPGHPLLARHYHNRGGVLRLLKRFDDALASYERAKELRVASFAPDHPRVALTLNSMGLVELDRGDLNAAAKRFERAALLLEAAGDHRRARPLTNQALVLERRRKRLAALRAYRRARAAWVSGVGDGAPQVAEVERAIARLSAKAKPAKTPPKAAVGAGKPDPAEGKPKPAGPAVSPSYGSTPTWTRQ